jgi:hypothetical protein
VLANYTITSNTADFTIDKRVASVTPNAASKTYGDLDPAFSGTLTNFVAGDNVTATYSRTLGETVAGSPYTISAALVAPSTVLANYTITSNTADFTIDKRVASVTPNAASKTYGDLDPAFSGTLTNFVAADNVTATYSRTPGEFVAGTPYTISASLAPAGVLDNYTITSNTAPFAINRKAASVTPNAAGKAWGTADPVLTGTLLGFLSGDGVTAVYSRVAGEAAGPYTISASLAPAAVLDNYAITSNTAPFTITSTLSVALSGTGVGSVTGSGISCPGDCTENFSVSTLVPLVATAAPGSVFLGWTGACSGTGLCTIDTATNHGVTATFAKASTTGRMTGGGSVFTSGGMRVTHGMTLQCTTTAKPVNLEINWDKGDKFKLDALTSVVCYDDAVIGPAQPQAGFDTLVAAGTGKFNNQAATIEVVFTDAGEPGVNDNATIIVRQGATVILTVSGRLDNGNHQAHKN